MEILSINLDHSLAILPSFLPSFLLPIIHPPNFNPNPIFEMLSWVFGFIFCFCFVFVLFSPCLGNTGVPTRLLNGLMTCISLEPPAHLLLDVSAIPASHCLLLSTLFPQLIRILFNMSCGFVDCSSTTLPHHFYRVIFCFVLFYFFICLSLKLLISFILCW